MVGLNVLYFMISAHKFVARFRALSVSVSGGLSHVLTALSCQLRCIKCVRKTSIQCHRQNSAFVIEQGIRSMERVSAQCCCTQYTVIEIFDCNCNHLELGRFKVIQGQSSWSQSKAHWWLPINPIWPPLCPTSYLAPYSRYLMPKSRDLVLGRFKVIQGQRSCCHPIGGFLFDFY